MSVAAAISIAAAVIVNAFSIQVMWTMWSRRSCLMVISDTVYVLALSDACKQLMQGLLSYLATSTLRHSMLLMPFAVALTAMAQVRARSPALALVQSAFYLLSSDVLIIQALLRQQGIHMPCYWVVFSIYFSYGPICVTFLFRYAASFERTRHCKRRAAARAARFCVRLHTLQLQLLTRLCSLHLTGQYA
jgi:hypothetical protein